MSEEKISLLNCNFNQKKIRINSPNSLIAIRLIGATFDDLRYLTFDEYIKKENIQYLDKDLQEERYNHYEQSRLSLINEAKKNREDLFKEKEKNYETSPQNTLNLSNANDIFKFTNFNFNTKNNNINKKVANTPTSTASILEREKLQKLIEKQENNIKLQIDYECMIEENRRKNMEKMRNKEIKEEKKRKKKEMEIAEKKEKEREKIMEKKRKEEEMIKEEEKKRKEEEFKEKRKMQEEAERKLSEEKERKNKMLERELKEKEFREKINRMNQKQAERLLEKEKELNLKDKKRQKNLEELRKENFRIMSEKRLFLQDRISKALNKNESKLNEKLNEYMEKQKKIENLKKQKELQQQEKLKEQNEEIIKRAERIKHVLEQYEEKNKLRILQYNKKMEEINKRKEEKQIEEMRFLEEQKRKKEEKEKKLHEIRNKFEKSMADSRQRLMEKIIYTDKKIKNQKMVQEKQLHIKFNKLYISREDRKNRVIRRERVNDFQRTQKMDKINQRMKRIDNMQKDRYLLEEERKKIEEEIHNKKIIMLKRLQNVIKNNKQMSKDEIMDYVFDVKHQSNTIPDNQGKNKLNHKNFKTISQSKINE